MATKDELKAKFDTGKIPTGEDFADLIDASGDVLTVSGVAPDASGNVALTKAGVGLSNVTNVAQASKVEFNALDNAIGEQGILVPAVLAETTDLDIITAQGTYVKASSQTVTNGPEDMSLHFILSVIGATTFCTQVMYEVNGTDKAWVRSRHSQTNVWTDWTLLQQQGLQGLQGIQGVPGTNGKDGFGTKAEYDAIIARLDALETP